MQKVDHTTMSATGPASEAFVRRWWLANKTERAQSIAQVVSQLIQADMTRQRQYITGVKLYGNLDLMGLSGASLTKASSTQTGARDKLTYNVIQSATDTVTAKIAKNKPKPMFLTSGGNYRMQKKAKKLDKFVEGVFYENEAHRLGVDVFRDACIIGDGVVQVFEHNKRVKYDKVFAGELFVDAMEAYWGNPRQLHRVKNVDREVLMDLFPSKKSAIAKANATSKTTTGSSAHIADQITVVESWHLPSGKQASDGMHCITIAVDGLDGTLFEEKWNRDHFPFAKFPWCKKQFGYWSQSLCEQIQPIQIELNKILWVISRSFHLAGSFKILLQNGSKVVKEHLNNDIGAIISYNGVPPQYITPPIIPMEMYQQVQELKASAFQFAGVSMLSAQSQKPQGLNSGKALREYNDIESDRFMTIGQNYEHFFLDLARLTIECAKEIYEEEGEYSVRVPEKKYISRVDWEDVDLEEDDYVMKMYPVSSLPKEPSGRLQTIQEYIQAGMLSPRSGQRLLDYPDLEQVEDLKTANEDYLTMILDKMEEDALYTAPEGTDDLTLAKELVLEYIARGKLNGVEEEKLALFRQFNDDIEELKQAAMPPPAAPMGAPQANPMATPQSDLVPNVAGVG